MALEATATYIDSLVITNPVGATDIPLVADDHLRLIKGAIKRTFAAISGPMTATATQLDAMDTGMRGDQNLCVSATHSYTARPKYSRAGGGYSMGGHYGMAIDTSGTAITNLTYLLGWQASKSGTLYRAFFPGAPSIGKPSDGSGNYAAAKVTPMAPSMRASGVTLTITTSGTVVSYVMIGQDNLATAGPSMVLLNVW
jgi:hypothetical protein